MARKLYLLVTVLFMFTAHAGYAQGSGKTALVKGILINSSNNLPFSDLKITIPSLNVFSTSDADGSFVVSEVPYGTHVLIISGIDAKSDTISVTVDKEIVDLNQIKIVYMQRANSQESIEIPTISLTETENYSSEDDGVTTQSAGGEGITSRDPFYNSVNWLTFNYWVKFRNYTGNAQELQVNGVPMNDVETGNSGNNSRGGLTDVFRGSGRTVTYGLAPSIYTFGGLLGSIYYPSTAADQWKGEKISYSVRSNNNNKLMATISSGLMENGWAYSFSFARRWEQNGYVPGTFYDGYSYYGAVTKVIKKSSFSLTTFGAPTKHGKAASATEETFQLAGTNYYNRNWGYMPDGSVRNAKVQNVFQPITILNYEYKPSENTRWNTAVAYEFGKDKNSNLTGYNSDPSVIGDYYRNLPSYYLTLSPPDSSTASAVRARLKSNPSLLQLNWNRMYQANYANILTMQNVNGIAGNSYTGRQSIYIVNDDVKDLSKFTFNTNIEHSLNENITVYGGITAISQKTEVYNQAADLLGGDYFVNFNNFASQQYIGSPTFNQNNLKQPNAVIKKGDKFGYDYAIRHTNALVWGQSVFVYDKFDFFIAANAGTTSFNREGYMQNGLFPNNSYGTSATHSFFDYGVKGGVTYKFNGRNSIFVNAAYTTTPPTSDNTYISAQTRDFAVASPTVQNNQSLEGGYLLRSTKLTARVVGYVTDVKNATEIKRFYNDDPAFYTFVNYVMSGENTRSIGTELMLDYKLTKSLNVTGVANVGQAFYTNRPNINVYLDNDTLQNAKPDKAYINNYYLSVGPQTSYVLAFNYRPKLAKLRNLKYPFVRLNFNYLDNNYVSVNPNRLTEPASGIYPAGSAQWHQVFDQEKLPSVFTTDLNFGTTIPLAKMSKPIYRFSQYTALNISASVNNLFNNTDIINFGSEQLRYDYTTHNPYKFPNKYIYGMGINFSLNVSLKF